MKKFFSSITNVLILILALYLIGSRVPQWWALYQEQGETMSPFFVFDLRTQEKTEFPISEKKSVLVFWATWCGPCTVELDRIQKAIQDNKLSPEHIHAISLKEDPHLVLDEVQKRGYTFKVYADPSGESLKSIKVFGTPTLYFVRSDSTIEKSTMGLSPLLIQNIQNFLK